MEKGQFAILRFAKYKGPEIGRIEAHNERTKEEYASNPDIDTSRSHLNFHLKFWEHMVKKYPVLERGESASETGRDHIPPRVFKQMTRLTKQMEKLDAMLSDVKFTNYKERTAQIAAFLEEYIPDVAAMETQMKKYQRCFTTAESEKKALKKKNDDLTEALEKSQQQSTVKKLQEARLQSDYERVKGILDRIPPEIIRAYTQRGSKKQEVNHYSGLE